MRNLGRQKHDASKGNFLKNKYHEKLKEYKKKCRSKRFLFWQTKFKEIENSLGDSRMFWEKWKNASEEGPVSNKPEIVGKEWYNHFFNLHTEKREGRIDESGYQGDKINQRSEINEPFSKKEFMFVIKKLKNGKAAGYDSIFNELIANSPEIILNLIHKFINMCLKKGLLPQSWCLEIISPIFKDGSTTDPGNYRGICVSSALLKVVCSLLNNRIQVHCNKLGLINRNQIGFKRNHRTADHLLTLKAVVKKYVTIGEKNSSLVSLILKKPMTRFGTKVSSIKLTGVGYQAIYFN